MVTKRTWGEIVFDIFNYILMSILIIIMIYPFYYVLVCSISDSNYLIGQKGLMLKPLGLTFNAYKAVMRNPNILSGYKITLIVVVVGTAINILMTSMGAYILSRKQFGLKKAMMIMILITMYFSGGLIPSYLLIFKYLNLGNNLLALILPGAISAWNLIIMRTNFQNIPESLEESAKIDGANDFVVLFRIIIPVAMPIIAVMILFYGVAHWNSWFGAMIYIRDKNLYPLQLILREILLLNSMTDMAAGNTTNVDDYKIGESIKYATIVVSILPVICIYPLIQRYFVKGIMVGAIKG